MGSSGKKMELKDLQQQTPSPPPATQKHTNTVLLCSVSTKTSLHGIQNLQKKNPNTCRKQFRLSGRGPESLVRGNGAHESGVWCLWCGGGMAAGEGWQRVRVMSAPSPIRRAGGRESGRVTGCCRVRHTDDKTEEGQTRKRGAVYHAGNRGALGAVPSTLIQVITCLREGASHRGAAVASRDITFFSTH